jgi:hypothetical protein
MISAVQKSLGSICNSVIYTKKRYPKNRDIPPYDNNINNNINNKAVEEEVRISHSRNMSKDNKEKQISSENSHKRANYNENNVTGFHTEEEEKEAQKVSKHNNYNCTADELFPLFVYVILHSDLKAAELTELILYLHHFLADAYKLGEGGYCLVTLEAAVRQILFLGEI